jgi:hypothetical protein
MTFYNFRRPHQAMNNQTPMAVWRAGVDKIEAAARAVDMPLRLDNANALPTYPQQKQLRSDLILEGQGQARLHLKSNDPWSHEWGPVHSPSTRFTPHSPDDSLIAAEAAPAAKL